MNLQFSRSQGSDDAVVAQVRANWLKLTVGVAKRQPSAIREPLLAAIPDDLRSAIRKMGNLSWVDAAHYDALCRAIHTGLGPRAGAEFWRTTMNDSLQKPLLKPLRDGALGIFGRDPGSLFRYSRQAWSLVTRDFCTVAYKANDAETAVQTEESGKVTFAQIAPSVDVEAFSLFCVGAARAVIDVVQHVGTADLSDLPTDPRSLVVDVHWQPRR